MVVHFSLVEALKGRDLVEGELVLRTMGEKMDDFANGLLDLPFVVDSHPLLLVSVGFLDVENVEV